MRLGTTARAAAGPAAVVALLVVTFLGGRFSVSTFADPASGATGGSVEQAVWEVKASSIGRELTFPGEITAVTAPGPVANVDGMLTAVPLQGTASVAVGTPVLEVELRPIVAGQGTVPAFRELKAGDTGADVVQLRGFLCVLRHLKECGNGATFTPAMTAAVQVWQKSLKLTADGVVSASAIMWFPTMPVEVRTGPDIAVGQRIAATDRPLSVVSGPPRLVVRATADQAKLVPEGSPVRLGTGTEGIVRAITPVPSTGGASAGAPEAVDITVSAPDADTDVCATSPECKELIGTASSVPVDVVVVVVPPQEGPAVPVRAVLTKADGTTYVRGEDGRELPLEVVGASGGLAVVEGLELGQKILVAAGPDG